LTERFGAARDGDAPIRATIPAPVDEFVGRASELRVIAELLDEGTRLITVVGPGGVGKTRLALEAARQSLPRFRDGAAFVPLDRVTDPALVAPGVVATLALRSDPAGPLDTLAEYLRERSLLLVLDNFEQVLDAAPMVTELLARCAEVSVVVTSRSALRVRGEHELAIEPLELPDASDAPDTVAEAAFRSLWSWRPHGSACSRRRRCSSAREQASTFSRVGRAMPLAGSAPSARRSSGASTCSTTRNRR
jgi:predicted ATPase